MYGHEQRYLFGFPRRTILSGFAGLVGTWPMPTHGKTEFSLGFTPVFLDNDIKLLSLLQRYLGQQLDSR